MDFGFTLKPDHPYERTVALTRQAEAAGFSHGWMFDSHVLWRDPYPLLTVMAINTSTLRLGTCVTNPATRDPSVTASALATLNEISGGRMDLGIGRGDSARRVMGKPPTTLARLEESAQLIRQLVEGDTANEDGTDMHFTWTRGDRLPVWIAGYGPKALELTARIADGLILQVADVDLIRWFVGQLRAAASAAGRDPKEIKVMAAAPAHVGELADCRDRVRWFPALVSNHVVDLVNRYDPADLPPELTGYVRNREGYDYLHHAEVGSSNASFVSDDVVDRFSVIGSVEAHVAKLRALADAGVDQFNIYLMNGDEEQTLDVYGREIMPQLAGVASS
jgi:probable F420-dependent oxidoreductase